MDTRPTGSGPNPNTSGPPQPSAELRTILAEHRDAATMRHQQLLAELDALLTTRRGESDDDEHDPEGEPLSAKWSMLQGMVDAAAADVRQAVAALENLQGGDYGICQECGQQIPPEQLAVRPFRVRCVACVNATS